MSSLPLFPGRPEGGFRTDFRLRIEPERYTTNVCKVFSAKPFSNQETASLPLFRTTMSLPFQRTGVDFAGPLRCRGNQKTDEVKVYCHQFHLCSDAGSTSGGYKIANC